MAQNIFPSAGRKYENIQKINLIASIYGTSGDVISTIEALYHFCQQGTTLPRLRPVP